MPEKISVASADFIRNIGHWQNEALRRPLSITHHGRERLVLAAPEEFLARQSGESVLCREADTVAAHAALKDLIDNIDEAYLAFDQQLRVRASNIAARAFCGCSAEVAAGATALELLPEPLGSILTDRLQRVLRARKAERFEAAAFDGRHAVVKVLPAPEGAVVLFLNTTEACVLRQELEYFDAISKATRSHSQVTALRLDARARIEWIDERIASYPVSMLLICSATASWTCSARPRGGRSPN